MKKILVGLGLCVMTLTQAAVALQVFHSSTVTTDYVVWPGDVLSVVDRSGSMTTAPVLPDGSAVINEAGVIQAAGMSLSALTVLVNKKAERYSDSPNIVIKLDHQRRTQVYLLGSVIRPGLYTPPEDSAGKKDFVFTISQALLLAGGLKEEADIRHIHVTRQHPKQVLDVDLWKLMLDGDVTEDLTLLTGDVIFVPKGGTEFDTRKNSPTVLLDKARVMGAVNRPGLFPIDHNGEKLASLIAKAGGFTRSQRDLTISISRMIGSRVNTEKIVVKNSRDLDVSVTPGDVIVVQSALHEAKGFFSQTLPTKYDGLVGDFGPL